MDWEIPFGVMMGLVFFYSNIYKNKKILPKNIEYINGEISGMNLLHFLVQFNTVLLIDDVDFKGKPGEAQVFSIKDIRSLKKPVILSIHDSDFLNILRLSQDLKDLPERLIIFGVQPRNVTNGIGVPKEIGMILDDLCLKVQKEIQNLIKKQRREESSYFTITIRVSDTII